MNALAPHRIRQGQMYSRVLSCVIVIVKPRQPLVMRGLLPMCHLIYKLRLLRLVLVLCGCILNIPSISLAVPSQLNTPVIAEANNASSASTSFTISGGTNRILIIRVYGWNDPSAWTTSSCTYNSVGLTNLIETQSSPFTTSLWILINPSTGSTLLPVRLARRWMKA